jgi:hypothetical protein
MLDVMWSRIEQASALDVEAEILCLTYVNAPTDTLEHIMDKFDEWSVDDFISIINYVMDVPPLEGESIRPNKFGEDDWSLIMPLNEATNLYQLPHFVWKNCQPCSHKKLFF